jgi:hypothetical protein
MDPSQVDLTKLPAEQRAELYKQIVRRARAEQANLMREKIAWLGRGCAAGVLGTARTLFKGYCRFAQLLASRLGLKIWAFRRLLRRPSIES